MRQRAADSNEPKVLQLLSLSRVLSRERSGTLRSMGWLPALSALQASITLRNDALQMDSLTELLGALHSRAKQ